MELIVQNYIITNSAPFALIAGPCVIENQEIPFNIARTLKEITTRLSIPFIFKASFDKANRSSIDSYRGPGIEKGLAILADIKHKLQLVITTDVHESNQVQQVAKVVDLLQVPAFLCRQTDLLIACAKSGKPVNVKKAQFLSASDMNNVTNKLIEAGCNNYMLTERGSMFGYNNLVVDFRNILEMKKLAPLCFDGTHSVQRPGGLGSASGGNREYVVPLTTAAVSLGVAAVFWEVHPDPDKSLSDGPNMLPLDTVEASLKKLLEIDRLTKKRE